MDEILSTEHFPLDNWLNKAVYAVIFPVFFVKWFLMNYGWYCVGAAILGTYIWNKLKPKIKEWQESREDAYYKKNPDVALTRMEEIQRVREKQQQMLEEASRKAAQDQAEKEERKRAENLERLEKYGSKNAGNRLGTLDDTDLPLSRGASSSSYKPPKRSACGGGGCGR